MSQHGTLIWFRSDLRVADNTALLQADPTRPRHACFVATPEQWRTHHWGKPRVGFVRRNVQALAGALAHLGIPLHIVTVDTFADVPACLQELMRTHQCDRLVFNEEPEVNERARDEQVRALLDGTAQVDSYVDQTILDVTMLKTGTGGDYTVFTPFKKRWLAYCAENGWSQPRGLPQAGASLANAADVPHWEDAFDGVDRADLWGAGEQEAHKRLQDFAESRIAGYQDYRDLPAVSGTSVLSPYLASGVVSPRQCLRFASSANGNQLALGQPGPDVWISELIWREFYRHVLLAYPRVCRDQPFKLKTRDLEWRTDADDFAAWSEGRTGVPFVDAGIRQLLQTGWMHNRVRMVVAMFLSKNLLLDWRWGERFFMQHLVDADFASNNGGWQWSASTGTDAVPYFRIFNPFAQCAKFDPEGAYVRKFIPGLKDAPLKFIHDPLKYASQRPGDYPPPMFDYPASRERALAAFKALA